MPNDELLYSEPVINEPNDIVDELGEDEIITAFDKGDDVGPGNLDQAIKDALVGEGLVDAVMEKVASAIDSDVISSDDVAKVLDDAIEGIDNPEMVAEILDKFSEILDTEDINGLIDRIEELGMDDNVADALESRMDFPEENEIERHLTVGDSDTVLSVDTGDAETDNGAIDAFETGIDRGIDYDELNEPIDRNLGDLSDTIDRISENNLDNDPVDMQEFIKDNLADISDSVDTDGIETTVDRYDDSFREGIDREIVGGTVDSPATDSMENAVDREDMVVDVDPVDNGEIDIIDDDGVDDGIIDMPEIEIDMYDNVNYENNDNVDVSEDNLDDLLDRFEAIFGSEDSVDSGGE